MALFEQLKLADFRNCERGEFSFSGEKIVFTGPNGSGKTNLLESICFLSILRSFRSASGRELTRIGSRGFELSARICSREYPEMLKVIQQGNRRETWIGSNRIRRSSEFIREFRTVVFVPEDRSIVGGSSSFRRRFFDMLISTLDGIYLASLVNFNRALAQRNRALKVPAKPAIAAAFEPELAKNAPLIARRRREFSGLVEAEMNRLLQQRGGGEFRILYRCDYPEDAEEYRSLLERSREKEMVRGCTGSGPQLDEFEFFLNGRQLRYYGSTGQIRLISLLLKLAEFNLVRRSAREKVAVLVDDVTGELDEENKIRFFETIADADQQFYTFTEFPSLAFFADAEEIPVNRVILRGGREND
ncbi:DNA replication/repair protein RecF [uncultured Victivallis sp.]|uniref:DNA replication/repair protein RecF n=1 Tax=uncultured Victivallis sp. TaxID=354118 RepID=UPI0025E4B6E5|nr:DNA replication and repair protein RecF [uncultured Victivallis sp.]